MTKIAFLGASGMIGSSVKAELDKFGPIKTLGRSTGNDAMIDMYNPDAITPDLFRGTDTLVHCAGVIDEDFKFGSAPGFLKGTYASKKLTDAAYEAGVRTFIYISSAHIYGPLTGEISERNPPDPVSDYSISHYASEQIFRRTALRDPGSRLLILRPCATYGIPPHPEWFQRWTLVPFLFPKKAVEDKKIILLAGSDKISRNFVSARSIGQHMAHFIDTAQNGTVSAVNPLGSYNASIFDLAALTADVYAEMTGQKCDVSMADGAPSLPPTLEYSSVQPDRFAGQDIRDFLRGMISILTQARQEAA